MSTLEEVAREVEAARQRSEAAESARDRALTEAAKATTMLHNLEQRLTEVGWAGVLQPPLCALSRPGAHWLHTSSKPDLVPAQPSKVERVTEQTVPRVGVLSLA